MKNRFFPCSEYRGCRRFEADAMQPDGKFGNPLHDRESDEWQKIPWQPQNAPAPACGPADNGIALYHADAKGSRGPEDGGEASDTETRMKESATKENAAAEAPDAEVSDLSLADNDQLAVSGGADEAAGIPVEETVKSPLEPDSTASENAGEAKLVIESHVLIWRSALRRLELRRKIQDDQTMVRPPGMRRRNM